jgi:hypothetical protein
MTRLYDSVAHQDIGAQCPPSYAVRGKTSRVSSYIEGALSRSSVKSNSRHRGHKLVVIDMKTGTDSSASYGVDAQIETWDWSRSMHLSAHFPDAIHVIKRRLPVAANVLPMKIVVCIIYCQL